MWGAKGEGRICSWAGYALPNGKTQVVTVLGFRKIHKLGLLKTQIADKYPSLTPDLPEAHIFERELWEQCKLRPVGHPWLKPVRYPGGGPEGEAAVTDFFSVAGQEIHEVAVGPVHAGVIEPGHFRFQCHGENVFHLEIHLGYQHRGVERALVNGPDKRSIHFMETLSGDTSIGHATAYALNMESLGGAVAPVRAQAIRAIALELERLANHTGDLGALAVDVGFLPTSAQCGKLRGDFLNMTGLLCGNRFGRRLVRPGGVTYDLDAKMIADLLVRLKTALQDLQFPVNLLWATPSVMARFEEVGKVSRETAESFGLVGMAARACGIDMDVRHDFPAGMGKPEKIATCPSGDVFARAKVRWLEIQAAVEIIEGLLNKLPAGPIAAQIGEALKPSACAVALTEGWRGEICHVAITNEQGRFAHYKVVDPSFHNWTGLAMALRDLPISDFPLNNKSFNLSYCGFDL
jgi:Ni,Fe-hydrogenase III large subunit